MTTNFDPELIVAVELAPDRGFQEVRYPDDLDPALLRLPEVTPLYFAHGRADATDPESADTLVLGTADFSLAYEEPGAVRSLVSALLLRHPVLFLGAEMRDPHFRRVVDEVSRLQGQLDEAYRGHLKRPPRLALIGAPLDEADDGPKRPGDLENSQRLEELDIQVRWYDSSNLHMELDDVLRLAADASGKLSTVVRERGLFAGDDTQ